jgi:catechol 2,3-dioxygenase-like lactoylglutathione lyase family enzyme
MMPTMDWKLELITIPVSDVDRAKAFYTEKLGFIADHDHRVSDELRFVQLTPPGSGCSIALGTGMSDAAPGSVAGMQLVVPDIGAARDQLAGRDVDVSDVQEFPWGSFVFFADPDGNRWSVQQLPPKPPTAERLSEFATELKDKSQDFLQKHDERIGAAIDKTAGFVDEKTKGKYSDRIGTVAGKAKGTVDKLAGKAEPGEPSTSADETPEPEPDPQSEPSPEGDAPAT